MSEAKKPIATIEQKEFLVAAQRCSKIVSDCVFDLQRTDVSADRLDRYWKEFLINFANGLDRLNKMTEGNKAKSVGDKAKHVMKKDKIVQYIYQSRHSDIHVTVPVKGQATKVYIGRSISLEGDGAFNVDIRDNYSIDASGVRRKLPEIVGRLERGKIASKPLSNKGIEVRQAHLKLIPAKNRGQIYDSPDCDVPSERVFIYYAEHCDRFLKSVLEENVRAFEWREKR